jgi:FkbM family methyltransferase
VIETLAPGVPAVRVRSAYAVHRHTTNRSTTFLVNSGLFVHTGAKPKTPVVRFPSDQPLDVPDNLRLLGWLVRVDVAVRSGSATCGYTLDGGLTIAGEQAIDSHGSQVDLILDDSARDAHIVFRAGADKRSTELIVGGFECYGLLDEASEMLEVPDGVTVRPMPRWARFFSKPGRGLDSRVRSLRFSRLAAPSRMRWLHGLELTLVPQEQMSRAVYVSGLYEPCTTSVLRALLSDGATCIDVGANIGLVSLLASRWVGPAGRVIAFEPSVREFARLREHIERNALANVEAVPCALGDREGTATLHVAEADKAGHNTLEERFVSANVTTAYAEPVRVVRLDDYARDVTKVDVIKIDVEGCESQVIEGAQGIIARDRPALLIEVAGAATASDHQGRLTMESSLRVLGYQFVAIDGDSGSLRHVADLTARAENFLAALPDAIDAVDREIPITGWRPKSSGIIAASMESSGTPYLSIVLTGRNDGAAGDFHERFCRSLEFNHAQLDMRGIPHEFVVVEWRPATGPATLAEYLAERCAVRAPEVVRSFVVDAAYHDALSLNPRLEHQEFIARNVGIRRSRGAFVLTTSADILLGRGVLDTMQQRTLQPRVLYRAQRIDLKADLDGQSTDWSLLEDERNHQPIQRIEPPLYSSGAGDFLLLDRDSYLELRGFNEVYRLAGAHVDRNFCLKALSSGLTLTPLDAQVYHIGHARFDDHTAGDHDQLDAIDWNDRRWRGAVLYDNDPDWGVWRAPVRRMRDGVDVLEFSWDAVPPAVSLRRVVLPVARQTVPDASGADWRPDMDRPPYPITVTHRDVTPTASAVHNDRHVFHNDPAVAINRARLEFLATIDLPLDGKRVLDAGCGVGHHTPFYTSRGSHVVGIDGRAENIDEMRQRYPEVEGVVGDLQTMDLEPLGMFDVVHCLGLLYHTDSPVQALRRLASVCQGQLVIETMVCDADRAVMLLHDEAGSANQALAGLGCRPSPSFVAMALDRLGFPYVYGTTMPPQHVDFQFEWRNNLDARRDGANLRCMFVASRTPLTCDHLTLLVTRGSAR